MKISFVVPSFNCAAWLPHAVKSCQEQTVKDIEIIVVDDCSTDSTKEYLGWLSEQKDKRVKIIWNHKNMGRSESRNIGNRAATGDLIAVLDADDLAVRTRAEWTMKKFLKTNCQVCYGSAIVIDPLGNALHEIQAKAVDFQNCVNQKQNGIVHSTVAYTKEIAMKYPYSGGIICRLGLDDWEQQIRMLSDGVKFDFIPDIVTAYRNLESGISKTRNQEEVNKVKDTVLEGLKCKV